MGADPYTIASALTEAQWNALLVLSESRDIGRVYRIEKYGPRIASITVLIKSGLAQESSGGFITTDFGDIVANALG